MLFISFVDRNHCLKVSPPGRLLLRAGFPFGALRAQVGTGIIDLETFENLEKRVLHKLRKEHKYKLTVENK